MNKDELSEEAAQYIQNANEAQLAELEQFLNTLQTKQKQDWWDGLPQHVKDSLDRARAQALAGGGILHEDFRKMQPHVVRG